jgi:hypothetical protein
VSDSEDENRNGRVRIREQRDALRPRFEPCPARFAYWTVLSVFRGCERDNEEYPPDCHVNDEFESEIVREAKGTRRKQWGVISAERMRATPAITANLAVVFTPEILTTVL